MDCASPFDLLAAAAAAAPTPATVEPADANFTDSQQVAETLAKIRAEHAAKEREEALRAWEAAALGGEEPTEEPSSMSTALVVATPLPAAPIPRASSRKGMPHWSAAEDQCLLEAVQQHRSGGARDLPQWGPIAKAMTAGGFPRTPQQARCRYNRVVRGGVRNRAAAAPPRVLVLPLNDENLSPVERTDSLDSVATAALSEVSPSPSPPPPPDFAAKPLNFVCAAADCGAQNELKIPADLADENNRSIQANCHACAALNEVTLTA